MTTQPDQREDLVRELARHDDWRDRVLALKLPERDALSLRIDVVRARVFRATALGVANARRRRA